MTPFRLGLTGSIGMGKSTTAGFFRAAGIPVWDADATVHNLYAAGGAGARAIAAEFPDAIEDGAVSRPALKKILGLDPRRMKRVEQLIHPLVAADRASFLADTSADLVLLDIPLLYETGAQGQCDAVLLCTAPAALQKARVLARPGMTEQQFSYLHSLQIADAEKRKLADHIVETLSLDSVQAYVSALIAHLRSRHA